MEGDKALLSIVEAGQKIGVGRTTMYAYIGAGELEVIHVGRLAKVHREALEDFIRRLRDSRGATTTTRGGDAETRGAATTTRGRPAVSRPMTLLTNLTLVTPPLTRRRSLSDTLTRPGRAMKAGGWARGSLVPGRGTAEQPGAAPGG